MCLARSMMSSAIFKVFFQKIEQRWMKVFALNWHLRNKLLDFLDTDELARLKTHIKAWDTLAYVALQPCRAKIVDGRLGKYAAERSLLEQPYIKDPKKSVGQHIKEIISQLGEHKAPRVIFCWEVQSSCQGDGSKDCTSKWWNSSCVLCGKREDVCARKWATLAWFSGCAGENIAVRRFARYTLGEGLAKKQENFAEEIAKATGGQ